MDSRQLPICILLLKITLTTYSSEAAHSSHNNQLCENANCFKLARIHHNLGIKKQIHFPLVTQDNLYNKSTAVATPIMGAYSNKSNSRNHKRVRKKKTLKQLKRLKRRKRKRTRKKHRNISYSHHNSLTTKYHKSNSRATKYHKSDSLSNKHHNMNSLSTNYHNLKRHFNKSYKTNIYENHDKLFFPVTKFGNFTGNEIQPPFEDFTKKEFRRTPQRKRRRSRLRHLNPHSMKVKKLIVRIHNVLRGRVSPPAKNMLAMTWHEEASEQAQRWADECKPSATSDHPSVRWTPLYGTCGQNVQVAFKKKRWGRVVRQWWNERRHFRFGFANNYTKVHQYTQMAWYNSHKVGCGFSQCSNRLGKTFYRYVCNYCPGGNDPRRMSEPYTKGRQCGSCPNSCRSVCQGGRCKLCTNACPFSDLWVNCESLSRHWREWLCSTRTSEGINRFKNCRATCQCKDKIT